MAESLYLKSEYAQLDQFANAVWGNPDAVLRRSGDVEFIDLEHYPVLQQLFGGPDKILVREEYRIALQKLETETYYHGAYVTGQPGIGKTLFLIYVLVVFLGQKRAVALQLLDGRHYYALFHDSVSFHSLDDRLSLGKFPFLWALTDSNEHVQRPSGIFLRSPGHIRPIQTTSPAEIRWKEWSKQTGAKGFVMDIWSEKEIIDLATLLGHDDERMADLAKQWGCVPRTLLQFQDAVDSEIESWYKGRALLAILRCREMLPAIMANAILGDPPSEIFFCQPRIAEYGINRTRSRATVPTRTIRRLLGEALQLQNNNIKLDFFHALRQSGDTSQAADVIFENWFHTSFSAQQTIRCNWMHGQDVPSLTAPVTLVPSNWNALAVAQSPYFWIAPKHFPGVDSALVLKTAIYAFQITISSEHGSPIDGMRTLRDYLPNELKKLPWRVVFIGDNDNSIKRVAGVYANRIFFPTQKDRVPIAWSTVDPVRSDITYQEFREE